VQQERIRLLNGHPGGINARAKETGEAPAHCAASQPGERWRAG
jgi:hypothetical protein